MKTLLLFRHAKSDLGTPELQDFDRPLNDRGKKAATHMGQWIKQQHIQPEWIVCSPAQRARETLALLRESLTIPDTLVQFDERLYLADLTNLLEIMAQCPQDMDQIMLVGHNPGLDELLSHLCGPNLPLSNKYKLMTTATLAQVCLPEDWLQLTPQCGKLLQITRPAEIKQIL